MNKQTKSLLPDWWQDKSTKNLILSNDLDSLLSCKLLEKVNPDWQINYFYDFFTGIYWNGEGTKKKSQAVGVDIAFDLFNLKSFDNHVTCDTGRYTNPNLINLNNAYGINSRNYSEKYCCSTALLIYSLYDIPLPKTDTGKAILLSIDSTFKSYYNPINKNRPEWLETHRHWLVDVLGFPELYELEQEHTQEDFEMFSYINDAKIEAIDDWLDDTYSLCFDLKHKKDIEEYLEIDLTLPQTDFKMLAPCKSKGLYLDGLSKGALLGKYKMVSFAMTGKNHCNFSYKA